MKQNMTDLSNLSDRIKQIRTQLCFNSNTEFAKKINRSTHFASQLCTGASNPGSKMLDIILSAFPEVSRSWLYFGEGEILKANNKPDDKCDREIPFSMASEEEAPYGSASSSYLLRENDRLWKRYDEAQQTIGSLRSQLSQLKEKLNTEQTAPDTSII